MAWKFCNRRGAAALSALLAAPLPAAADLLEPFSGLVTALTRDWEAEDWDDGELKLHPDRYTWQSDMHLTLRAAEPANGRSLLDVARLHFDGFELDDDTLEPTVVDMSGAESDIPGMISKSYRWASGFDDNFSMFGTIQRADGLIVPYRANCEVDVEDYPFEQCLTGMTTVLVALMGQENMHLTMPDPPAPISVPFWESRYDASGATILSNRNFHGTVTATVIVTAPTDMPPDNRRAAIEAFSDGLVDEFDDQVDEDPGTVEWVGSADDPWIRRTFPEAFSGPSTVMAGTQATPDGKTVLIGMRCPNDGWRGTCARAVSMSQQQIASGQAEQRRTAIVSQTWGGFPDGGLKNSDIEAVYNVGEGSSASGFYQMEFTSLLLMKDGTACKCFDRALGQILPSESKIEDPDAWGRWVKQGGAITLTWADGETEVLDTEAATLMAGGDAQTRIQGDYTHTSGSGNFAMGTSSLSQSFYTFGADGTFSSDRSSSYSVALGGAGGPDGHVSGGSSGAGPRGTYEIDGYNMKLTYPDGRIQWMGFAQAKDEAATPVKTQLMLDGMWYYNDDD